jgi:LVIVD repeat
VRTRRRVISVVGPALVLAAMTATVIALSRPAFTAGAVPANERAQQQEVAESFEVVGRDPLLSRGMNSAAAAYKNYLYVGSRTDGSSTHSHPGVLVVDIKRPSSPRVVGEIGPPNHGIPGETSRELRVWPQQRLLLVLSMTCDVPTHGCSGASVMPTVRFYDLTGRRAAAPELIATYSPSRMPHEMFLWTDGPKRALLYLSTWKSGASGADLIVTDISRARRGEFDEIVEWNGNARFTPQFRSQNVVRLHSMGVSTDGARTYVAYQGAGFFVLDSSDLAAAVPNPELRLLTPVGGQPTWGNPGAHSAIKIPGRELALATDEVYGNRPGGGFQSRGCPWGWTRLLDISDESTPAVVGEYKIRENEQAFCSTPEGQDPLNTWFTSYSSHNPTVLGKLAFITWHSGGLHAVSIDNPRQPSRAGLYLPEPLPAVATEDPVLSSGRPKVVMWSYPIIRKGLIYVVDIRNGLYVLRYTGPGAKDVAKIKFLEGNSNLGDAAKLERRRRR